MKILSIVDKGKDIIGQCIEDILSQQLIQLKKSDVSQKCIDKVMATIKYFLMNDMIADGWSTKTLEDNIIEFRIALPKSKYLLRIFAGCEKGITILLTGYLIKPHSYDDSRTTSRIENDYMLQVQKAKVIRKDYTGPQQYDYVYIQNNL